MKLPALPGFNPEAFDKYLKNTGWLMLARVGSLFIKMLITAFALPNYLGSSLNGTLNYPLAFLSFFIGAITLGTDGLVTRQLLQHPEKENVLLGSAFRMRLVAGFIALPLIYFVYILVAQHSSQPLAASLQQVGIVSLICIIQSVNIIDSFFQSTIQGKKIMLVQVGGNIISALIKFILILAQAPIDYFIWMLVADALFLSVGYLVLYQKQGKSVWNWKYDASVAKDLLKIGWPLAFSAIFISLYMKIDQLMIGSMLGTAPLGIYTTVVTLSESWYFIPVAISTSLFPAIMGFRKNKPEQYIKRLSQLYDLMAVISVTIALVTTLIAPYFYAYFYKPEFYEGYHILQIHIWAGVFTFLATASGQYLIAEGLTNISLFRTCLGALTNIVLNYILIPKFGMLGAAYSTLIAYFVAGFSLLLFSKTRSQGYLLLRSLFFINIIQLIIKKLKK